MSDSNRATTLTQYRLDMERLRYTTARNGARWMRKTAYWKMNNPFVLYRDGKKQNAARYSAEYVANLMLKWHMEKEPWYTWTIRKEQ